MISNHEPAQEHPGLANKQDVKDSVIAYKIAANLANLAKTRHELHN